MGTLNIELNKINATPPKEYFPADVSGTFSYAYTEFGYDDEFGTVNGDKTEQLVEGARAEWGGSTRCTDGCWITFDSPTTTAIEITISYSGRYHSVDAPNYEVSGSGTVSKTFPTGTTKGYIYWDDQFEYTPIENYDGWFTIDSIRGVTDYGASGYQSTALGKTNAKGDYSLSVGETTTASGEASVALGLNSIAHGIGSAVIGSNLTTDSNTEGQVVVGSYNAAAETAKFVVGTGSAEDRGNALEVYSDKCNIKVPISVVSANKLEITGTSGFANNATSNNDTYKCEAGNESIAFGRKNIVSGVISYAFGGQNTVSVNYAGSLGYQNTVNHKHGIAIGRGNTINGVGTDNSTANQKITIGNNLTTGSTTGKSQVIIGNNNSKVKLLGTATLVSTAPVVIADNNVDVIEASSTMVKINTDLKIPANKSITLGSTTLTEAQLKKIINLIDTVE